ncbi:hypothetical protein O7599_28380 [Streptomyces sp. WMMC500]|uniref:hypothetical protein n=1 Tax=Streptomyces sp. WMMC500 TaxID=3015154 RepID=UPI00248B0431|nr:hypothetical protein [Streptomyces sp. WMMC500]WBB59454.1 hypothetical protein O7599_28380 [Streptomyces sp. WMMC500]
MQDRASSRVTGTDPDGHDHTVHVTGAGARRKLQCESCDWNRAAQFLPWLKAEEHLAEAHRATTGAGRTDSGTAPASGT